MFQVRSAQIPKLFGKCHTTFVIISCEYRGPTAYTVYWAARCSKSRLRRQRKTNRPPSLPTKQMWYGREGLKCPFLRATPIYAQGSHLTQQNGGLLGKTWMKFQPSLSFVHFVSSASHPPFPRGGATSSDDRGRWYPLLPLRLAGGYGYFFILGGGNETEPLLYRHQGFLSFWNRVNERKVISLSPSFFLAKLWTWVWCAVFCFPPLPMS